MKNLAIIPARGGSKRIPRKNILDFCGKPIIAYSIEAALASGLFARVIVSTDSEEIATVAKQYGAEVPFMRPEELSTDNAYGEDVILHALKWVNQQNCNYEYACCIYATAPFIQIAFLQEGLQQLKASDALMAFSVTSFEFPILRGMQINKDGRLELFWPEYENFRSQELPESYHDAGQFYWYNTDKFIKTGKAPSFDGAIPIILPRYLVQDIDTPEDWKRTELMYKLLYMDKNK